MTSSFQNALVEVLAKEFTGEYREDLATATASWCNTKIAAYVESLVSTHLGVRPSCPLFAEKSVGVVFGLELINQRCA